VKFTERLAALNRLQRTTMFKIVATAIVVLAGASLWVTYVVRQKADDAPRVSAELAQPLPTDEEAKKLSEGERQALEQAREAQRLRETMAKTVNGLLANSVDRTAVGLGIGIVCALSVGVIWIGLGLTGLAIALIIAGILFPLHTLGMRMPDDAGWTKRWLIGGTRFLGGVAGLGLSFVVLMELLRLAFSGPYAVFAIARNVVNEAVRMKVSLVFIVLLVVALAALPGLLDESTPLRYRVQSFLQYGTGFTFWLIAILTLFLAVGSVAFEQRDKIIWQTMTKPVASWQYLLGKWLGAVGVSAVLLGVSASGVFLFTEYLRGQRAAEEDAPYFAPGSPEGISPDRLVLENQILTARASTGPEYPRIDDETETAELKSRIERIQQADPNWQGTPDEIAQAKKAMDSERNASFLTVEGGAEERYVFKGLLDAKERNVPVTFRFRLNVGANDPRETITVSFAVPNASPVVRTLPGGHTMTFDVLPSSINEKGELEVVVLNGNANRYFENAQNRAYWANTRSITFPPDGIEVYFSVGSYRVNFLRVAIVLWLKLAFLAMVAVWAATYLSFSVASLVAFGVFLIAESAAFLNNALEYFASTDQQGNIQPAKMLIRAIAVPVAKTFEFYSALKPVENLVDGRLVSWLTVAQGVLILGALTGVLYLAAILIFRKRELATYSGQ
jgi:ABC-type transport system involved in multi-copper enzyme maturation permease subunit